jgi:hypothetical protein
MTCVSELCANAIAHTDSGGGVFIVEVSLPRPGVARVAVTDEGGASVPAAGSLDLMAEGGRGLAMVAACTNRWGYADAHPGRVVWAEACWPVLVSSPGHDPASPAQHAAPSPVQDAAPSPEEDAHRSPGADPSAKPSRRPRLRFPRSSRVPPDNWPSGPAA